MLTTPTNHLFSAGNWSRKQDKFQLFRWTGVTGVTEVTEVTEVPGYTFSHILSVYSQVSIILRAGILLGY